MTESNPPVVHIGTSGWYYASWVGPFYPENLEYDEWLNFYVQSFSSVEINASFYHLPLANVVRKWIDKAPAGFVFAAKGSRQITHFKRLEHVGEELTRFFERMSLLAEHLGPILWQLPPNMPKDAQRLDAFLAGLSADFRHAVEFRHPSWLAPEIFDILRRRGAAHVAVSSKQMPADLTVTADFAYVRLHGLSGGCAHDYSSSELQPWQEHIRQCAAAGKKVFVYFNNDSNARAPKNALDLRRLLGLKDSAPPVLPPAPL